MAPRNSNSRDESAVYLFTTRRRLVTQSNPTITSPIESSRSYTIQTGISLERQLTKSPLIGDLSEPRGVHQFFTTN